MGSQNKTMRTFACLAILGLFFYFSSSFDSFKDQGRKTRTDENPILKKESLGVNIPKSNELRKGVNQEYRNPQKEVNLKSGRNRSKIETELAPEQNQVKKIQQRTKR